MCALPALLPLQESSLILSFCTCSQIPSLSQTRIVPQLMERGSWGKLWWAIINQPATEPSRYSKHRGSAGWRLRNPLLLVFSGSATVLHSWGATFDCRSSNVYSSCCDWLLCWHRDAAFQRAFMKLWIRTHRASQAGNRQPAQHVTATRDGPRPVSQLSWHSLSLIGADSCDRGF